MKCPLQEVGVYKDKGTTSQEHYWEPRDCLEAGCAWWNEVEGRCSVRSILSVLKNIDKGLGQLVDSSG